MQCAMKNKSKGRADDKATSGQLILTERQQVVQSKPPLDRKRAMADKERAKAEKKAAKKGELGGAGLVRFVNLNSAS